MRHLRLKARAVRFGRGLGLLGLAPFFLGAGKLRAALRHLRLKARAVRCAGIGILLQFALQGLQAGLCVFGRGLGAFLLGPRPGLCLGRPRGLGNTVPGGPRRRQSAPGKAALHLIYGQGIGGAVGIIAAEEAHARPRHDHAHDLATVIKQRQAQTGLARQRVVQVDLRAALRRALNIGQTAAHERRPRRGRPATNGIHPAFRLGRGARERPGRERIGAAGEPEQRQAAVRIPINLAGIVGDASRGGYEQHLARRVNAGQHMALVIGHKARTGPRAVRPVDTHHSLQVRLCQRVDNAQRDAQHAYQQRFFHFLCLLTLHIHTHDRTVPAPPGARPILFPLHSPPTGECR